MEVWFRCLPCWNWHLRPNQLVKSLPGSLVISDYPTILHILYSVYNHDQLLYPIPLIMGGSDPVLLSVQKQSHWKKTKNNYGSQLYHSWPSNIWKTTICWKWLGSCWITHNFTKIPRLAPPSAADGLMSPLKKPRFRSEWNQLAQCDDWPHLFNTHWQTSLWSITPTSPISWVWLKISAIDVGPWKGSSQKGWNFHAEEMMVFGDIWWHVNDDFWCIILIARYC